MADDIDIATERHQRQLDQLVAARTQYSGASAEYCSECDAVIPEARRKHIPGVQLCVRCQTIHEQKNRHRR